MSNSMTFQDPKFCTHSAQTQSWNSSITPACMCAHHKTWHNTHTRTQLATATAETQTPCRVHSSTTHSREKYPWRRAGRRRAAHSETNQSSPRLRSSGTRRWCRRRCQEWAKTQPSCLRLLCAYQPRSCNTNDENTAAAYTLQSRPTQPSIHSRSVKQCNPCNYIDYGVKAIKRQTWHMVGWS